MNRVLLWLQLQGLSVLSPDLPLLTQCSAWSWRSLLGQSARPIQVLYPQPGASKVLPVQERGGVGVGVFLHRGWTRLPRLFSAPSTILKPLTMPDIQITEVDAAAESDQASSPTGTRVVGGASSLGSTAA